MRSRREILKQFKGGEIMWGLECGWTGAGLFLLVIVCLSMVVIIPAHFVQKEKKMKLDRQQKKDQGPCIDKGDDWKGLYR